MKNYLLMTALFAICLVSCNKTAPDDEINIAKQDLTGEWARYKRKYIVDTLPNYYRTRYSKIQKRPGYFDTIYVDDILNTQVLKFAKDVRTMGTIVNGKISYGGTDKYNLFKNSAGKLCIRLTRDMEGYDEYKYYYIEKLSKDTLCTCFIDSSFADERIFSYQYSYYIRPDLEYAKKKNEKLSAAQMKLKGEWYIEKRHIVTDYAEGYTAWNGETHTDSTVVFTDNYPALKINCEHIPATNGLPSTFQAGTYSNGKATYDISPSNPKYYTEGSQVYIMMLGDDDTVAIILYCYMPTLKQDGSGYYLSDTGFTIDELTENSMTTTRTYWDRFQQTTNGEIKTVTVSASTITEYWKRQP